MCGHHADLIDKNTGLRYPAPVIKSWKALQEYRVAYEHSGRTNVFGFVRALEIDQSALFEPGTKIELGKTTFLIGPNDTGKTALCEWLSAIDSLRHLWRWLKPTPLWFTVFFDAPIEHHLLVKTGDGSIQINLDGSMVAFNHHRIAIAFLENRHDRHYGDDLEHLSDALGLDVVSTRSLAALVKDGTFFVKAARFHREQDDDGQWKENLYIRFAGDRELPFANLSSGERGRVLLEFAIAQMHNVAAFAPALLIIDWPGLMIDDKGLQHYLEYFSSTNCAFQTLITMFASTSLIEGLGWQTYKIIRRDGEQLRRVEAIVPTGTLPV
jgi:energy-coupling factor transporter ATP-binding protein EcfA2